MPELSTDRRLINLPISAPVWLWLAYAALIAGFAVLAQDVWPIWAAAFSYQFWTFAIHRGLRRTESENDDA